MKFEHIYLNAGHTKEARKTLSCFTLLLLLNLYSCGFAYQQQVTGRYCIIGVDTQEDLGLNYQLHTGDYIGRAPGQLLQYGFNDTFLVAKTQESKNGYPLYYIINMKKDSDLAQEDIYRIGPLTESEYNTNWRQKLNIHLKDVR